MGLDIWNKYHNRLLLLISLPSLWFEKPQLLILSGSLSLLWAWLVLSSIESFRDHTANIISISRLALLGLGVSCLPGTESYLFFGIFLIFDAIDGWVAHRLGISSTFGSYLDMEVDSLAVMTMALIIASYDIRYVAILLVGLARPISKEIKALFWPLITLERRSDWGRILFVIFFLALATKVAFPNDWMDVPLFLAASAIVYSFILDFRLFAAEETRRRRVTIV